MNSKILAAIAELGPLVESLTASGVQIYSIRCEDNYCGEHAIHINEPNGIQIGRQVTDDFDRKGKYDGHSVYIGSIKVFWLTEKQEAAA